MTDRTHASSTRSQQRSQREGCLPARLKAQRDEDTFASRLHTRNDTDTTPIVPSRSLPPLLPLSSPVAPSSLVGAAVEAAPTASMDLFRMVLIMTDFKTYILSGLLSCDPNSFAHNKGQLPPERSGDPSPKSWTGALRRFLKGISVALIKEQSFLIPVHTTGVLLPLTKL